MAVEIHVGDIGTVFTFTIRDESNNVVNLAGSTITITFLRPNSTKLIKTGVLVTDGSDGQVKYTTVSGDLDDDGNWRVQAFVDFGATEWYSDIKSFVVYRNL